LRHLIFVFLGREPFDNNRPIGVGKASKIGRVNRKNDTTTRFDGCCYNVSIGKVL
jgi:hypothetical protein